MQPEKAIDKLLEYLRLLRYQAQKNGVGELDYLKPLFDVAMAERKLYGLTRCMSLKRSKFD